MRKKNKADRYSQEFFFYFIFSALHVFVLCVKTPLGREQKEKKPVVNHHQ